MTDADHPPQVEHISGYLNANTVRDEEPPDIGITYHPYRFPSGYQPDPPGFFALRVKVGGQIVFRMTCTPAQFEQLISQWDMQVFRALDDYKDNPYGV